MFKTLASRFTLAALAAAVLLPAAAQAAPITPKIFAEKNCTQCHQACITLQHIHNRSVPQPVSVLTKLFVFNLNRLFEPDYHGEGLEVEDLIM